MRRQGTVEPYGRGNSLRASSGGTLRPSSAVADFGRRRPKHTLLRQGYGGYPPRIHPRVYTRGFLRRRVNAAAAQRFVAPPQLRKGRRKPAKNFRFFRPTAKTQSSQTDSPEPSGSKHGTRDPRLFLPRLETRDPRPKISPLQP